MLGQRRVDGVALSPQQRLLPAPASASARRDSQSQKKAGRPALSVFKAPSERTQGCIRAKVVLRRWVGAVGVRSALEPKRSRRDIAQLGIATRLLLHHSSLTNAKNYSFQRPARLKCAPSSALPCSPAPRRSCPRRSDGNRSRPGRASLTTHSSCVEINQFVECTSAMTLPC